MLHQAPTRAQQASGLAQTQQAPGLKHQLCWHLVQMSLQLRGGGEGGCAPLQPSPRRRPRVGA